MNSPARTRFAPSPTGFLHVGGVRTALFAWLIAQQTKGQFILRFEDTDKVREVAGTDQHIMDSLRWLGLQWDEGADIGGPYGPYRQSERLTTYKEWAKKLIDNGRAYADPYTSEELETFRNAAKAAKKPFLYRDHRPENPPEWNGSQALRFKSDPKAYAWHDEVMGKLSTGPEAIDDFVLIKADGYPTYNFCHIIDDFLMKCSHVIRSQEFVSSIPRFLNLYEALAIERPLLTTLPYIMGPDGKKKLSKRDGAKDILDYGRDGYLPEAMMNFLATLGWNDGSEQEIFSKEELIEKFSLERVQKSGARFDEQRLLWMNGQWIRTLSLDELYKRVGDFWPSEATSADESFKKEVLRLAQDRLKTLADLPALTSYLFAEPAIDWDLIENNKQLKKFTKDELKPILQAAHDTLAKSDFTPEKIQQTLNQLLETTGQKPGTLFSLIRIATTWAPFSPALNETMSLLGKEATLKRLTRTLNFL